MGYADSPELIASRLSNEITRSESNTHARITEAESRLDRRIHDLEMKLIDCGAFRRRDRMEDCLTLVPVILFVVTLLMCLMSHSRESSNTEPASGASHSQVPATRAVVPEPAASASAASAPSEDGK